jgi:hypothetical protein
MTVIVLINALTGEVKSAQNQMSGNPTNQELELRTGRFQADTDSNADGGPSSSLENRTNSIAPIHRK